MNTGPAEHLATGAQTPTSTVTIRFQPFVCHFRCMFRHMGVSYYIALKLNKKRSVSSSFIFIKSQSPGLISPQHFVRLYKQYHFLISPSVHHSRLPTLKTPPTVVWMSSASYFNVIIAFLIMFCKLFITYVVCSYFIVLITLTNVTAT
jgi:hypothetical protein